MDAFDIVCVSVTLTVDKLTIYTQLPKSNNSKGRRLDAVQPSDQFHLDLERDSQRITWN